VLVGASSEPSYLDREGIMHLSESGFPYEPASNTYIAGHAEGYSTSRVPHAFRSLKDLKEGDDISLRDASGKTYHYRVYERLLVGPYDYRLRKPVRAKRIVSLQTCFPAPTFEKRLVAKGKLVKV
jgi:LPXTG-site transpeptidase (sortase) family protein